MKWRPLRTSWFPNWLPIGTPPPHPLPLRPTGTPPWAPPGAPCPDLFPGSSGNLGDDNSDDDAWLSTVIWKCV